MKYKYKANVKINDLSDFLKKLDNLEYEIEKHMLNQSQCDLYAFTTNDTVFIQNFDNFYNSFDTFDCGDDINAFFGIIAIRDDLDKYQFWVNEDGASWVNLGMWIEPGTLEFCLVDKRIKALNSPKTHKASPEEIINYFKKNKDSKLGLK
jgi:hypothetical protein